MKPIACGIFIVVKPVFGLIDQKLGSQPGNGDINYRKVVALGYPIGNATPEVDRAACNSSRTGQQEV
ncbi:hypothetical protein [Neomoorella glycerini]|uniref:hypothetical protein n=1 Tax=Neomoorella glycerini TaxID=55779 RepID=UPI001FE3C13D|nr:hypothetical protein [Moorella glycerini]